MILTDWKNGLRNTYWLLLSAATTGPAMLEDELPMMASPAHIRHCIDLIRQSLMCQPDLAIEEKGQEKGGVSGFGESKGPWYDGASSPRINGLSSMCQKSSVGSCNAI